MNRSAHQVISAGIYNLLLFMNIDAFWEKTHVLCTYPQTARPGLEACFQVLAPGDLLVVWRLDRLGRSMGHLVTLIEGLLQRQVGFRSLSDGAIETTTASGELVFHI